MRLCQWIKQKESYCAHLKFLFFCGDKKLIVDLPKVAGVTVTDNASDVIKFATEDLHYRIPTVAHTEPEPQVTQPPPQVVPQPELLLQSMSNPQQAWLTPSHLKLHKHRRRDQDPDISMSFRGSSWQIGEYEHMESKEKWIIKVVANYVNISVDLIFIQIPGDPPKLIVKEILGALIYTACSVITAQTKFTKVGILNSIITDSLDEEHQLAVASKLIPDLCLFGESFIEKLLSNPRGMVVVQDTTKLEGFWEMLAVAHWIGDRDCLGASGKNAGFVLQKNERDGCSMAVTCKIDTGFFGEGFSFPLTKIIFTSPRDAIHFDSLYRPEKILFLKQIKAITKLTEPQIYSMVNICVSEDAPDFLQREITPQVQATYASILSQRQSALITLFKGEYSKVGLNED